MKPNTNIEIHRPVIYGLLEALRAKGMSRRSLAKKYGLQIPRISNLTGAPYTNYRSTGKNLSPAEIKKICDAISAEAELQGIPCPSLYVESQNERPVDAD